jgi:hypothetical protein
VAESSSRLLPTWTDVQQFLHVPVDARVLAIVRIGYAALMLVNVACWGPDLDHWFSQSGVLPLDVSRRVIDTQCLSLFQVLPTDSTTLHIVYAIFVSQLILLLIGWRPRLQAACCHVWLVSFQHRNPLLFEGEDTLFRIIGFLLILMPSGLAWSMDSLIRFRRGSTIAATTDGWSVRILQLEMTMLYFSAAWSKLLGEPWRNGTALYYVTRLDEYWGRFPVPLVGDSPVVTSLLTWGTIAVEFAVPVLIWFAPTRRPALMLVLVFHLACDYAMHLFLFHWLMLVGWAAFLQPADLAAFDSLGSGNRRREQR